METGLEQDRRGARQVQESGRRAAHLQPRLRDQGMRRLALTFVNHAGAPLVKVVPLERIEKVAREGVGFSPVSDAWRVDGLPDPDHPLAVPDGDLRLIPDLGALLPLEAATGWCWAPAERWQRDGTPYGLDQRGFCRRRQALLAAAGIEVRMGFEIEWTVARPGAEGQPTAAVAGGPYGADRVVNGLDYLAALTDALDAAGLPWLQVHPEYGAGQFELSLAAADPLSAADRQVAARLLIQRVTDRFGWRATFSPLPDPAQVGNGGHLHLSLRRHGVPLLQGGSGTADLPAAGEGLLGSLLHHLPALLAIGCPLAVSYRRLGPGRWSAPFRVWGVENREAALRLVPAAADGAPAHLEIKGADLAANPYLLCGAVLALLEEGLRQPRPLPPPVAGDPAQQPDPPERLPTTLEAASAAFAACRPLAEAMGEGLHRSLVETQRAEGRRAAALDEAALIASTRWLPPFLS
ncbi:MAG: glutamine synthetase [Synechococcaceae cyanobacterium]|nr:glutamine synthetase [Synechococcaceae cyanobacterium]